VAPLLRGGGRHRGRRPILRQHHLLLMAAGRGSRCRVPPARIQWRRGQVGKAGSAVRRGWLRLAVARYPATARQWRGTAQVRGLIGMPRHVNLGNGDVVRSKPALSRRARRALRLGPRTRVAGRKPIPRSAGTVPAEGGPDALQRLASTDVVYGVPGPGVTVLPVVRRVAVT
jgi:hypothetical protein